MLIGSYDTDYDHRRLWIHAAGWSVFAIGGPLCLVIVRHPHQPVVFFVLGVMLCLTALFAYLWVLPWRIELTADELRWHTILRTGAVPLSRVQSISRGKRSSVYVKIDGRRWDLWIEARPGRLGTFAADLRATAPHVNVSLSI